MLGAARVYPRERSADLRKAASGLEPAEAMLKWVATIAPSAEFVVGAAEAIPLRDRSVDLITAAGSLNYANLDLFFPEAARVLAPHGVLLVYDFSPGRSLRTSTKLDEWFSSFHGRYPPPANEARELSPEILSGMNSGFRVHHQQQFEIGITLDARVLPGLRDDRDQRRLSRAQRGAVMRKSDPGALKLWRLSGWARSGKCCSGDISPVWGLLHLIGHGDIHCLRRIAGPVAARLIAQLSGGRSRTGRSVRRHLEVRHQVESPGIYGKRLLGELVLLQRGFGVRHRAAFQRTERSPRQLQRDQRILRSACCC